MYFYSLSVNVSTMVAEYLLVVTLIFQACIATPIDLKPRITDGVEAKPGEFPYQVSIQWGVPPIIKHSHSCGGSIINERYILTAGHCILPIGSLKVIAGKHLINEKEANQQEVNVMKAIVHKDYNGGVAQHDIAILKLETPLVLGKGVSAVGFPAQDEKRSGNAVLTGWGSTSKTWLPVLPKSLQKVTVPILDNPTCKKQFPEADENAKLYDTQICTGANGGEVSACSGDSGGPLVQFKDNKPTQIGIVSWGFYPCGVSHAPSVYTRVASYIKWIHTIIDE